MTYSTIRVSASSRGSALLIVLAFLLLLTTIIVAFLSRATFERQLSNASYSQGKVDLAGQGAIAAILGDLQQEIMAGSNGTGTPTLASGYYYPTAPATVIPAIVGFTPATGLEDLLKISYPSAFYSGSNYNTSSYPAPNRASAVATTTASLNGRTVTAVRWNQPLFLAPTSSSNYTPSSSSFVVPDWIYVARDGSNPTSWDSSYQYLPSIPPTTAPVTGTPGYDPVTQRYAYAIYDEGSTLDLNVAGSPSQVSSGTLTYSTLQPYKNALAYADLSQLPGISSLSAANQSAFVNAIVGWRNFASSGLTATKGIFPNTYTFSTLTTFDQNVIFNTSGFLSAGGPSPPKFGPQYGPNAVNSGGYQNQTDNAFASRQQLLQFIIQGLGQNTTFYAKVPLATLVNVLPCLGTFSRDISQPSYAPNPAKVSNAPILSVANGGNDEGGFSTSGGYDNTLNPAFLNVTATSAFTRNDGTTAVTGEPLAKKRFALMRLAWLTYQGPSASRNITSPSSTVGNSNYDIWQLENTYGIPASFLAQGTAANIYKYFGLSWIPDTRTDVYGNAMDSGQTKKWVYNHTSANPAVGTTTSPITSLPAHPGSRNPGPPVGSSSGITTIYTLAEVAAAGRDPDFVELLKAAVCAGSIGKTAFTTVTSGTPQLYQNALDVSVDTQIIQMAANIIAQYKTDAYAPRILFDDGNWSMAQEYRGVEDVPYFFRVRSMTFPLLDSSPSVSYAPAENASGASPGADGDPYEPSQSTNTPLTNSGIGAAFNAVEIWDPHSWNPSAAAPALTNLRPTQFRLIMIDGPPTIAAPPTTADPNAVTVQGNTRTTLASQDYEASGSSSTVLPTPSFVHSISFTPSNSGLCFTIPQTTLGLSLFREPTLLIKPGIPNGSQLHFAGDPYYTGASKGYEGSNQVFNKNPATSNPPGEAAIQPYLVPDSNPVATDPGYGYQALKAGLLNVYSVGPPVTSTPTQPTTDYPTSGYTNNNLYLGIYLGSFPLKWSGTDSNVNGSPTIVFTGLCTLANLATGGLGYVTYRLQYLDPNNNWITYDEKYNSLTNLARGLGTQGSNAGAAYLTWKLMGNISDGLNNLYLDPRTNRFAAFLNNYTYQGPGHGDTMSGWSQTTSGGSALPGARQNATWGVDLDETSATLSNIRSFIGNTYAATVPGWYVTPSANTMYPGLTCQNNPDMSYGSPAQVQFFADADGIVRRGMSGYVQPTSTQPAVTRPGGISSATSPTAASGMAEVVSMDYSNANLNGSSPTAAAQVNSGMEAPSRPIMLNRPFRSVADLGYVFSGTPWRNLDMMTPESGAAALLDVFCVNDTNDPNGLVAGKVNLNTRQAPVLQAILAGAYKSEFSPTTTTIAGTGTSPVAAANVIAAGLVSRTTSTTATAGPLANISELVGKYSGSNVNTSVAPTPQTYDGSQTYAGFSGTQTPVSPAVPASTPANLSSILTADNAAPSNPNNNYDTANVERYREATIRALSNTTTTRVWNLMIDVIAQTGRFPSSASSLANFNVEGERRYWVHVAIDRYTGKVLDEQVEEVKE